MTIETCMRCGRARDDGATESYDDDWMPIFSAASRRANVVCAACTLPRDQAALEQWIDDFDQAASGTAALEAAATAVDDQRLEVEYRAHERFTGLFLSVDLQRLNVSQVDHWISAWGRYNELVRMRVGDPSRRPKAVDLIESLPHSSRPRSYRPAAPMPSRSPTG